MKVWAIIAVAADFPTELWEMCVRSTARHCEGIIVRMDKFKGTDAVERAEAIPGVKKVILAEGEWNPSNWREELVRELDVIRPDIVLTPDHDETFGDGFREEMERFWRSDKSGMMFHYATPMPTDDGRVILGGKAYPSMRHMLCWKWQEEIGYVPYHGYARPTPFADEARYWLAATVIHHYSMYTKEMEAAKMGFIKKWWNGDI